MTTDPSEVSYRLEVQSNLVSLLDEFPIAVLKDLSEFAHEVHSCCDFDAAIRGRVVRMIFTECPWMDFRSAEKFLEFWAGSGEVCRSST